MSSVAVSVSPDVLTLEEAAHYQTHPAPIGNLPLTNGCRLALARSCGRLAREGRLRVVATTVLLPMLNANVTLPEEGSSHA